MALIKCPKCGGTVSSAAKTCPHCGLDISDLKLCTECNAIITEDQASCPECGSPTPWSRKCPQCGNYMLPTEKTCPECGFDMVSVYGHVSTLNSDSSTKGEQRDESVYDLEENEKSSSKSKLIALAAISLVIVLAIVLLLGGKGSGAKDLTAQDESCKYDGSYDWRVAATYNQTTYKERFSCEIRNGEVVSAIWYNPSGESPLSGNLDGDILYLKGNNKSYPDIWIECTVDLRTGKGTLASLILPTTHVYYEDMKNGGSNDRYADESRVDGMLDKLESNLSDLERLMRRLRNGENVGLELDAYMMRDDTPSIIRKMNSYSFTIEQRERFNGLMERYQRLLK